jgi:hypothetical protein
MQYVVVIPDRVIGPFASEDDARAFIDVMFRSDDDSDGNEGVYISLTWSIKPLETP